MSDPRLRQITIKTGVLKRAVKECSSYRQQAEKERKDLDKLRTAGDDEYRLKKWEEVVRETEMMIPDAEKRMIAAYQELGNLLKEVEDLKENEVFTTAQGLVTEVASVFPSIA